MDQTFYGAKLGLMSPSAASKKIRDFVISALDLADNVEVHAAFSSRHSGFGYTSCGDVVVFQDGDSACAGHVYFHAECNGEPITLIKRLEVESHDRQRGTAELRAINAFEIIDTSSIVDAVMWHERDEGVLRAIVPRDL